MKVEEGGGDDQHLKFALIVYVNEYVCVCVCVRGVCVCTWCVYMVCVHGVCTWCVYMVCVHGVCTWCVYVVCVHGVCTWCVYMVCVRGVCTWCVYMVCVHGVCTWCVYMVCVRGVCTWYVYMVCVRGVCTWCGCVQGVVVDAVEKATHIIYLRPLPTLRVWQALFGAHLVLPWWVRHSAAHLLLPCRGCG